MIAFRQIFHRPDHWESGAHWFVEYHDNQRENFFPLGIAFVTVFPNQVNLDAVFVFDQFRRRGIGTQLVRACRCRWPGILFSPNVADFAAHLDSKVIRIPSSSRFACGEGRFLFE